MEDERKSLEIVKKDLNEVGPGFCAAKWFTSTIWLSNGRTSSCHHPPAHKITYDDIKNNPSGLHNTAFKKRVRRDMIMEKRPKECNYCWKVEDSDPNAVSDRYIKSSCVPWHDVYRNVVDWQRWPEDVLTITKDSYEKDYNPRILEISFDNLCNLACSYCNTEFSSTWANDIKKNGKYNNLKTSQRGTFERAVEFDFEPKSEENIYIKKFFEWFDSGLKEDLLELRITGGEPIRSPSFWKLIEKSKDANFKMSVNSNLIMTQKWLDKLVLASHQFKDFDVFTSCEAQGEQADFIRSGLNYKDWIRNLRYFAENGKYSGITVMMTINALCLFSITKFLDDIVELKNEYGRHLFRLSLNILRFPNFQSVNILPLEIKLRLADDITDWIKVNKNKIEDGEVINIERLVSYLRSVDKSYEDSDSMKDKINDFKQFYSQYSIRKSLPAIEQVFTDQDFIEWWDHIQHE